MLYILVLCTHVEYHFCILTRFIRGKRNGEWIWLWSNPLWGQTPGQQQFGLHHETTTPQSQFFSARKAPFKMVDGPLTIDRSIIQGCPVRPSDLAAAYIASNLSSNFNASSRLAFVSMAANKPWFSTGTARNGSRAGSSSMSTCGVLSLLPFSQRTKVTALELLVEDSQLVSSFPA